MKPLVSILIPAYNAGEWLSDTIRSAQAQTWENKEIVIVDDGSKDKTLAIARQFESDSVRVYTQENQGAAATRNKAFSLAKGDYIQWLDADDLLSPDKISQQMEIALASGNKKLLISCGWGQFMYRYYRTQFVPTPLWNDLSRTEWLARKMGLNLHMQTATWLVSRELTEGAGPWNTKLLGDDDGEYFCRVLMQSEGVRFVPDARVYYRASGASSLSYIGHSDRKRKAQWHSMKLHINYLLSLEDSERTRAACVQYMQNWLIFFYPEAPDLIEEMQHRAAELGGKLEMPKFSWKYSWLQPLFGVHAARRAQVLLPRWKWGVYRWWDKVLFRMAGRPAAAHTA
jgi:glycosyltransferase involved in cell wall biosynthesis